MASLLVLPLELVQIIFGSLDKRDLLSLSRTCKALNQLATPSLYKSIVFDNPLSKEGNWHLEEKRVDNIDLLLRSILNQPHLGKYIRSFTFLGTKEKQIWTMDEITSTGGPALTSKELELGKSQIHDFERVNVDFALESTRLPILFWEEHFENGLISAMLALSLLLLPNLETLVLDFDPSGLEQTYPFVGVALSIGQYLNRFKHLRHVDLSVRPLTSL
jgi:hypothetical protein